MNHEEQLIHVGKNARQIRLALTVLEDADLLLDAQHSRFTATLAELERYTPASYPDQFRIRSTPIDITEHLTEKRDMIPANLHPTTSPGRAYTLTKGQRAILRERYGMTPTKEVVVNEIAVWPAAPTCVRHISLRSTEHVPEHRRHLLNAAVIEDWTAFCEAAQAIDTGEVAAAQKIIVKDIAGNVKVLDRSGYEELKRDKLLFTRYPKAPTVWPEPTAPNESTDKKIDTSRGGNEKFSALLAQYM